MKVIKVVFQFSFLIVIHISLSMRTKSAALSFVAHSNCFQWIWFENHGTYILRKDIAIQWLDAWCPQSAVQDMVE